MPRYQVRVSHKKYQFERTWIRDGQSPEHIEQELIDNGFDKRYWNYEIFSYSVNGEDF